MEICWDRFCGVPVLHAGQHTPSNTLFLLTLQRKTTAAVVMRTRTHNDINQQREHPPFSTTITPLTGELHWRAARPLLRQCATPTKYLRCQAGCPRRVQQDPGLPVQAWTPRYHWREWSTFGFSGVVVVVKFAVHNRKRESIKFTSYSHAPARKRSIISMWYVRKGIPFSTFIVFFAGIGINTTSTA